MYYAWNWWWLASWVIPMLLLVWVLFGWNSGRYSRSRTYYVRDDDWDDSVRSDRDRRRSLNRGRGPRNYRRTDTRIMEDVCERLMLDDRVDATDIEVRVDDAKVTLSGIVATRYEKRVAESIVDSTVGVTDVENQLRIGAVAASARTGAPQPSVPAQQG